jgi:hypothetical protein
VLVRTVLAGKARVRKGGGEGKGDCTEYSTSISGVASALASSEAMRVLR